MSDFPSPTVVPVPKHKIPIPRKMVNKIEVEEDGKKVVYVAKFWGLYFDDMDIRGGAVVKKYVMKKLFGLNLFFKVRKWLAKSVSLNYDYIVSGGCLCVNKSWSAVYRDDIKKDAI
jgi:hypothetical protein